MESGRCNVIYFDRRATADGVIEVGASKHASTAGERQLDTEQAAFSSAEVRANLRTLLSIFRQVHVCRTGPACLTTIALLHPSHAQTIPTLLLVDVPSHEETQSSRPAQDLSSGSSRSSTTAKVDPEHMFGMPFLHHIAFEVQQHKISNLLVPIAMLCREPPAQIPSATKGYNMYNKQDLPSAGTHLWNDQARLMRYLDAGAVDIVSSPLTEDRLQSLPSHAYRTWKDSTRNAPFFAAKQTRKMSWVGVNEAKPFAYLRESMVSGLMDGICNPDHVDHAIDSNEVQVDSKRREVVADAIGTWSFSAHSFTDDELLWGALLMLQHALKMPELEKWRIGEKEILTFLIASRRVYNAFVLYHNFRHACDVLQAVFYFLLRNGALPKYSSSVPQEKSASPIASLVGPFHALTLLISAIGHDVGHPGVNNLFLVTLNAPLAQLYNDKSVLEAFHCAAYSQILRRYWPSAFKDTSMRKLMISFILATDMALHAQYMTQMGNLHEKLVYNGNNLDGWSDKVLEEHREVTCCLLIKCADICNVARKFTTAEEWARILTDEFHNQGLMESELNMPSCLFGGPPVLNDVLKMGNSQISFMNIFAGPLFEGVTNLLPAMQICVDEIEANKAIWQNRIDAEKSKKSKRVEVMRSPRDGTESPRSPSLQDLQAPVVGLRSSSKPIEDKSAASNSHSSPNDSLPSDETAKAETSGLSNSAPGPKMPPRLDGAYDQEPTGNPDSNSNPNSSNSQAQSQLQSQAHSQSLPLSSLTTATSDQSMTSQWRHESRSPISESSKTPTETKFPIVPLLDDSNNSPSKFRFKYWRTRLRSFNSNPGP